MLVQTKVRIDAKDHDFIKKTYKDFRYRSLSEYMREAVNAKVKEDRKRLREFKRVNAMEMIGRAQYDNIFKSIDGENFEKHLHRCNSHKTIMQNANEQFYY